MPFSVPNRTSEPRSSNKGAYPSNRLRIGRSFPMPVRNTILSTLTKISNRGENAADPRTCISRKTTVREHRFRQRKKSITAWRVAGRPPRTCGRGRDRHRAAFRKRRCQRFGRARGFVLARHPPPGSAVAAATKVSRRQVRRHRAHAGGKREAVLARLVGKSAKHLGARIGDAVFVFDQQRIRQSGPCGGESDAVLKIVRPTPGNGQPVHALGIGRQQTQSQ